jgi:molybdenum cofactor cytidylyltransferase
MDNKKVAAIVLAAGFSSRMHAFKPLLPLGDKTIVETTVATFKNAGIDQVIVVIGHERHRMTTHLSACDITHVMNEAYDQGMFGSVQVGVGAINNDACALFIMPVDIPSVRPQTIRQLIDAFDPLKMDILYPTHNGKRGHPPLISSTLISSIQCFHGAGGLKSLLNTGNWRVLHLEVEDEGILRDIDDEAAYHVMFQKYKG